VSQFPQNYEAAQQHISNKFLEHDPFWRIMRHWSLE